MNRLERKDAMSVCKFWILVNVADGDVDGEKFLQGDQVFFMHYSNFFALTTSPKVITLH